MCFVYNLSQHFYILVLAIFFFIGTLFLSISLFHCYWSHQICIHILNEKKEEKTFIRTLLDIHMSHYIQSSFDLLFRIYVWDLPYVCWQSKFVPMNVLKISEWKKNQHAEIFHIEWKWHKTPTVTSQWHLWDYISTHTSDVIKT